MKKKEIEEGLVCRLNFKKVKKAAETGKKLIRVIVQEYGTGDILMSALADKRAINYSLKNKIVALWSTSRCKFWIKGETSGNKLEIIETLTDCDQDVVLFIVRIMGEGACHTCDKNSKYRRSCFYRRVIYENGKIRLEFIQDKEEKC